MWGEYAAGRRQHRLVRNEKDAWCLCESGGRVFGGLRDGSLLEWDASTLEERQRLRCEGRVGGVFFMKEVGDLVISGHNDDHLRVWSTATGVCNRVLQGHTDAVWCVASGGQYLISGSGDKTVKVWANEGGSWPCLGTIDVHSGRVWAVVVWQGRVISGSEDTTIVVSDIVTQRHEATLEAHTGAVRALAVCDRTLLSTGDDSAIGVWALGTWNHLRMVRVSEHVPDALSCWCLAVSDSMLLCGGRCKDRTSGFVVVLDTESTTCRHILRLDHYVGSLLSVRSEVCGMSEAGRA